MKKVLLVVSLISVLLLAGCNQEEKIENDNIPEIVDNQQLKVEEKNINNSEQNEIDKYRLSDSYYIDSSSVEHPEYNIVKMNDGTLDIVNSSYTFESDSNNFTISVDDTIKINNEAITIPANTIYAYRENDVGLNVPIKLNEYRLNVGVIDLDEHDNYKEIVIHRNDGIDGMIYIYRVYNSGLKLLKEFEQDWLDNGLIKVNDKWVYCNTFYPSYNFNFLFGYDIYENGEFRHMNKFATGENITDENGNFPKGFQNIEFETLEGVSIEDSKYPYLRAKFNILSYKEPYNDGNTYHQAKYSIRVLEDSEYIVENRDNNGELIESSTKILPAGSVIQDVEIGLMW